MFSNPLEASEITVVERQKKSALAEDEVGGMREPEITLVECQRMSSPAEDEVESVRDFIAGFEGDEVTKNN